MLVWRIAVQADLQQTAAAYVALAKAVDTLFRMHRRAGGVDEDALEWKETVRLPSLSPVPDAVTMSPSRLQRIAQPACPDEILPSALEPPPPVAAKSCTATSPFQPCPRTA